MASMLSQQTRASSLCLESLESRLTPSQVMFQPADGVPFIVPDHADYYISKDFNVSSIVEPADASITLGNGVHGTVNGGMSDIAGQVHYQGLYTALQFKGGN